jgi:hypothetical protein
MRIGLITTLSTNIGDDLVREGICLVLRAAAGAKTLEFVAINKHDPLSAYPAGHPLAVVRKVSRLMPRGRRRFEKSMARVLYPLRNSLFDSCEMVVQCGTPVAWYGCARSEFAGPVWDQIVGRLSRVGVVAANLGAGSCYPWTRQPSELTNEQDAAYLRRILGYCRVTTVRDALAQRLFAQLGSSCQTLPCPAMLTGRLSKVPSTNGEFIIINYMEKGGHYDYGQGIDAVRWRDSLAKVVKSLQKRHQVLMLCHNEQEYELARKFASPASPFLPRDTAELLSILSRAKAGICNRLHAAVALAGIGIPSVAVGNDTRLRMVQELGLPCHYVEETDSEQLEQELESLVSERPRHMERLLTMRDRAYEAYSDIARGLL